MHTFLRPRDFKAQKEHLEYHLPAEWEFFNHHGWQGHSAEFDNFRILIWPTQKHMAAGIGRGYYDYDDKFMARVVFKRNCGGYIETNRYRTPLLIFRFLQKIGILPEEQTQKDE